MAAAFAAVPANGASAQPVSAKGRELFISPMGEPFRGASSSEQLRVWFSAADGNRDGALSLAELRADADRWFGIVNSNRDHEIDPAELRAYEASVPEIRVGAGSIQITSGNARERGSRLSGEYAKAASTLKGPTEREVLRRGAGRFGLLGTPNPVAAADTNFNRGITADEFGRAARDRFVLLDANRDGSLRFEELPPLPSRAMRDPRRLPAPDRGRGAPPPGAPR